MREPEPFSYEEANLRPDGTPRLLPEGQDASDHPAALHDSVQGHLLNAVTIIDLAEQEQLPVEWEAVRVRILHALHRCRHEIESARNRGGR
jgi:hypothetical protein